VALRSGAIAGAGLDVHEGEPELDPALLAAPNATLLPHIGSATIGSRTAMGMMSVDSIDAFVREDVELARAIVSRDKQLDDMNASANRQLTDRMMQDRDQLRGYLNLILISRCLERVGDHATNIAEDAVYAAAAEDIRHQS